MAGEPIRITSAWETILAAASVTGSGGVSGESGSIAATATLSANEKKYDLAEFELVVTGTPSADGDTVLLCKRGKANGNAPAPSALYQKDVVDSFVLKAEANGSYYVHNYFVADDLDTYYLINNSGTLTLALGVRTRSSIAAT